MWSWRYQHAPVPSSRHCFEERDRVALAAAPSVSWASPPPGRCAGRSPRPRPLRSCALTRTRAASGQIRRSRFSLARTVIDVPTSSRFARGESIVATTRRRDAVRTEHAAGAQHRSRIRLARRALMSVNIDYRATTTGRHFYDDVFVRIRAYCSRVGAWAFPVPFDTYGRSVSLYVEGASTRSKDGTVTFSATTASEDFVNALGLRLGSGRDFTVADSVGAPLVMVISRQLATRLWPAVNPVGQRARRGGATGPEVTVVGVVEDAKFESLGPTTSARVYLPLRQRYRDWQTLVIHTRGDPVAAIPELKRTVSSADPALPVYGAITMELSVRADCHVTNRGSRRRVLRRARAAHLLCRTVCRCSEPRLGTHARDGCTHGTRINAERRDVASHAKRGAARPSRSGDWTRRFGRRRAIDVGVAVRHVARRPADLRIRSTDARDRRSRCDVHPGSPSSEARPNRGAPNRVTLPTL